MMARLPKPWAFKEKERTHFHGVPIVDLVKDRKAGVTLQKLGARFGVGKERMRQILHRGNPK